MYTYNSEKHNTSRPNVGVTIVPLVYNEDTCQIETLIYIRPENSEVFPGKVSLPNGVYDRQVVNCSDQAAELALKSKVNVALPYIEQLYTFSGDYIDPYRINTINITYLSILKKEDIQVLDKDNSDSISSWVSVDDLLSQNSDDFAFNHYEVLEMAYSRLKAKADYSPVILKLLPDSFTIATIKGLIEFLVGEPINDSRFRDRVRKRNLIIPVKLNGKILKGAPGGAGGQPPIIYTLNKEFAGSFFPRSLY